MQNHDYQQVALKQDKYQCPHCNSQSEPMFSKEAGWLTFVLFLISFPLFGILNICLLPLIIEGSKCIVKRCPDCQKVVETKELLSFESLTDEVFKLQCGSCMIIISRKYIMIILSILVIFQTHKYVTSADAPVVVKELSWLNFISDCGRKVYLQNEVHAKHLFQQDYFQKPVDYTGVFMKLEVHYDAIGHVDHYHLLVKMLPTDSNEGDVMLIFSQAKYKHLHTKIQDLKISDAIQYQGEFNTLGDEFELHKILLYDFQKLNYTISLQDIQEFKPKKTFRQNKEKNIQQ